jgi:hypothetical protein
MARAAARPIGLSLKRSATGIGRTPARTSGASVAASHLRAARWRAAPPWPTGARIGWADSAVGLAVPWTEVLGGAGTRVGPGRATAWPGRSGPPAGDCGAMETERRKASAAPPIRAGTGRVWSASSAGPATVLAPKVRPSRRPGQGGRHAGEETSRPPEAKRWACPWPGVSVREDGGADPRAPADHQRSSAGATPAEAVPSPDPV